MTKKIFKAILLVAGVVLVACLVLIVGFMYEYFKGVQERQMKDELDLAAAAVNGCGGEYLSKVSSDRYRLTLIAADGTVVFDTKTDAETLENHADRQEIRDAFVNGEGESSRYSSTLLEKTIYRAVRLEDGSVLRISISRATIGVLVLGMLQPLVVIMIITLILSGVLANSLSKRIVEPLNELDLEHPLDNNDSYEELAPLLNRINRQHLQITEQLCDLQKKKDEFEQITASMQEGLILLDNKGTVLSINAAAQKVFDTDDTYVGSDFLIVERSHDVCAAIHSAIESGHGDARAERGGRVYRLDISRIESDDAVIGAVILAFDITEQERAEQSRREFTANVSHELKTPLQGIIGSAELIESGLVKEEDMPRFVGHIRSEAQRLVTLIGDIIRLSQLDEGVEMPFETVDLLKVAQETAEDLHDAAAEKNIEMTVTGTNAAIKGVRRLLYEIVYNLCDNAIKYNVENGRVNINAAFDGKNAVISIADTGIGIAPEQQDRVFERFYRVDKSHSKASGGTGLGLSIVKHAVQYHHGKISLKSELGRGTTISVSFPA